MPDTVSSSDDRDDWPRTLEPYWIDSARVLDVDLADDERPGRDSLGNAGHVRSVRESGTVSVQWTRRRAVRHLQEAGLDTLRDVQGESELHRAPEDLPPEDVDPFLLENSVRVLVQGRDFPGQQRAVLEAKAESLRREIDDPATAPERREKVEAMLRSMQEGLQATIRMQAVTRRFRPLVQLAENVEAVGAVVPIAVGTRLVYRVQSLDPETGEVVRCDDDEGDGDGTMVFHVVALGDGEVVVLYTGEVHGLRHLADLEQSHVHDAWFVNRERARTEATAPWLGRAAFRELRESGTTKLVVHTRRDPEPIDVRVVTESTVRLRTPAGEQDVPVLECRTSKDDELTVLADPLSPLVLRLKESGVGLLRTVDAVLGPVPVDADPVETDIEDASADE